MRDRVEQGAEAALEPDLDEPVGRLADDGDEERVLVREVAEDGAAGESGLGLEAGDRRSLEPSRANTRCAATRISSRRACLCSSESPWASSPLYKNVRSYYYRADEDRSVSALVAAEIVSILGSRMTYLALPWFVLVTTGSAAKMSYVLAAQLAPMALLGIPSGTLVERLGARRTMLVCDAARIPPSPRRRPGHGAGLLGLPLPARARLPARLLHCAVLRGAAGDPARARRGGRADDRAGEQPDRGRNGRGGAGRGRALAGALIPVIGAPNVLYVDAATVRRLAFLLLAVLRTAHEARGGEQAAAASSAASASSSVTACWPRWGRRWSLNFVGSAVSATIPFYAFASFGGSFGDRGRLLRGRRRRRPRRQHRRRRRGAPPRRCGWRECRSSR